MFTYIFFVLIPYVLYFVLSPPWLFARNCKRISQQDLFGKWMFFYVFFLSWKKMEDLQKETPLNINYPLFF